MKKDIACIIPTWLCARQTLGAFNNFRKYYPDIPVYFIDDEYTAEAVDLWQKTYTGDIYNPIFDADFTQLLGLPNTAYIRGPHEGWETEGHGNAITKAMRIIRNKWIVHLSSDVRLLKEGILENMFKGVDDKYCGIGEKHKSKEGWDNARKELCIYRGDLYHEYGLNFNGGGENLTHVDCGTYMYRDLVAKGYKMKYLNLSRGKDPYILHLRSDHPRWKELY